jgi:CO/xanthine dehydrogenase FAD-binding subunit
VAAGRRAAAAIDAYLRGEEQGEGGGADAEGVVDKFESPASADLQSFSVSCLQAVGRALPGQLPLSERDLSREDAPVGLAAFQLAAEAGRCFNCGCIAVSPSDLAPALVALEAEVVTTHRTLPAADLFAPRLRASTVLEADELITEVRIPAPPQGRRTAYAKFRLRKAIDFPILSVACALDFDDGAVKAARVVLGAAAPVPVRASAAESYLAGKVLDRATVEEAARRSVVDAMALPRTRYKTQVAVGMVTRALLEVLSRQEAQQIAGERGGDGN